MIPCRKMEKSSPFQAPSNVRPEIIAWCIVTDNLHVSMIVERIGSTIYTVFTIYIGIHDIARTPACSPVRRTSVGKMFVHLFLSLCDPNRLVSPDIPQNLAFIIRTQGHCFIRIPKYFTQVVGYNQANTIVEFLNTVSPTFPVPIHMISYRSC